MRQAVIGAICVAAFSIIVYAQRPPSNASSNSSGLTAVGITVPPSTFISARIVIRREVPIGMRLPVGLIAQILLMK